MLRRLVTTIRNKWQTVAGAIAVLLMFFVPVTRAVLAAASSDKNSTQASNPDKDKKPAAEARKTPKAPKTPVNPSPKSKDKKDKPSDK